VSDPLPRTLNGESALWAMLSAGACLRHTHSGPCEPWQAAPLATQPTTYAAVAADPPNPTFLEPSRNRHPTRRKRKIRLKERHFGLERR
jgi:hypothetical protein